MSVSGARWPADPGDHWDGGDPAVGSDWLDEPRRSYGPAPAAPGERRIMVVRRLDLWSVLKFSLVLYSSVFVVFLAAGIGLWLAAKGGGAIDSVENLIEDLGLYANDSFRFREGYILRVVAVAGPILVVLASLATVAGVALFNLAAKLIGGVEMTVSDETENR